MSALLTIRRRRATVAVVAAAAGALATPAGGHVGGFAVTYAGTGVWRTVFHSEPPNPGGAHDTNAATDTSAQRWSLRWRGVVPLACGTARCTLTLTEAHGTTSVSARIDHVHRDGLYRFDDMAAHCTLRAATPAGGPLSARLRIAFIDRDTVRMTAFEPVADALLGLPLSCPGQTDAIDGIADGLDAPGFSFTAGFGPARWFTSSTATVRLGALRAGRRLTVALGPGRGAAPPRSCAVGPIAHTRCRTGGSWRGTITLVPRP